MIGVNRNAGPTSKGILFASYRQTLALCVWAAYRPLIRSPAMSKVPESRILET